ncbi:MAG: hypothetical protein ACRDKV_00660 [Solirubrobacterales bacterium]
MPALRVSPGVERFLSRHQQFAAWFGGNHNRQHPAYTNLARMQGIFDDWVASGRPGPEQEEAPDTTVTGPDGQTYSVTPKGQVYDENGNLVVGGSYNPETGGLLIPGYNEIDTDLALGPPTPGNVYERDLSDPEKFQSLSFDGEVYYRNRNTNRVFDDEGRFVGSWADGSIDFFEFPEEILPGEEEPEPEEEGPPDPGEGTSEQNDGFQALQDELAAYGITDPRAATWLWDQLVAGRSESFIRSQLRQQDWYRESDVGRAYWGRIDAGFAAMSEQQILQYRDEARRLGMAHLGIELPTEHIVAAISNNFSLAQFENRLQMVKAVDENQGLKHMMEVYSAATGNPLTIDDKDFADFLDPERPSAELDELFADAFAASVAFNVGLGERSREEIDLIQQLGLTPDQIGAGYIDVAGNLDTVSRLATLEENLKGAKITPADLLREASTTQLVQATLLRDPRALREIGAMSARAVARGNVGGGVAGGGLGLLTEEERRREGVR